MAFLREMDRRIWRGGTVLAVALTFVGTSALPAVEAGKTAKAKVTLSPEMEATFADLRKKAGEAKRKYWTKRMTQEVERVTKATGLDGEGAKALATAAQQSADACLEGWISQFGDSWRQYLSKQTEGTPEIEQIIAQLDQSVQADWFGDYVRPFEHPKWEEGVKQALSAEQFKLWEKAQRDRNETIAKEIDVLIKKMVQQECGAQRNSLLGKGASIKSALALPKERAGKIDALAETAVGVIAESLRRRGERMLFSMDDEQRQKMLKSQQFYLGVQEKELEAQETVWKEGLAGLLSPEETKRVEEARENFRTKRATVMAQVMVTQLDEKLAFTANQRERLRPIAERLVRDQAPLFPESGQENFYRIDPQSILGAGANATPEELKAILDEAQLKHWQEACSAKNFQTGRTVVRKNAPPAAGLKVSVRVPEPEDLEQAFSDFFQTKSTAERKRVLASNLLKAEDAARVAKLAPAALGRLNTAARGATEESLAAWKPMIENSIRSQLRDVTAENVRQRLEGMENYSYRTGNGVAANASIWDKTLKQELTEAERAAWETELNARTSYRDTAIAGLILSEFDRRNPVSAEQWSKLETLIVGAVKEYSPDIGMMFSSTYPYAWYLQSYSMFIPFAAIPEKDLKAILGEAQWSRWSKSEEMGNTSSYWENVQRYHTQRVKEKP